MDRDAGSDTQARFEEYIGIGARPCRPDQAIRGLLYRSAVGGRAQERRTAGGGDSAGANCGATPVAAAFLAQAPWSDQAVLRRVRERVLPSITRDEPIQAWIIDDTGFPEEGQPFHSVGVARQYCGQLGKQDNCQVAVSLSVATHQGSLPVAYRLYLPKEWADERTAGQPPACRTMPRRLFRR